MCGIWLMTGKGNDEKFYSLSHRGPDTSCKKRIGNITMGFHRLAINDLSSSGEQPMEFNGNHYMCNGEIYNWKELANLNNIECTGASDCEIIGKMFSELGGDMERLCNSLDGVFAFVVLSANGDVFAARDRMGVRPLFYGYTDLEELCFASEAKGLQGLCTMIQEFPPGHYFDGEQNDMCKYASVCKTHNVPPSLKSIKHLLTASVEKRLITDRPLGFFLSGGLDSSLMCSIGTKILGQRIKTFSIGVGNSPDLECAKMVSKYLDTDHTEIRFTVNEGYTAVREVITALESYDCTTVRASVPMYLMSKYVKEHTDIRVVISGEGADELFGGYLYLHNAPTIEEFQKETERLLKNVYKHDITRADRCVSAHGLELRVPFFDRALVDYIISIDPLFKKTKLEKKILRDSFVGHLPNQILYRQKDGMSDAVGYSWVDHMRHITESMYNDDEYKTLCKKYEKNKPQSKEELYYREVYSEVFGDFDNVTSMWRPQWTQQTDPSAKLLPQHEAQKQSL